MRPIFTWQLSAIGVFGVKTVGIAALTALSILNSINTSAQAAQTVVVRRGSSTQTIDVADLKTLAETGKASPSLQTYARRLRPEERETVLSALKANFNMNPVAVRNLLDTATGNSLVSAIANATSRSDRVGELLVKSALVSGARTPEGLSLIRFIEAYPSRRLEINLDRAFQVAENFNRGFWQSQAFI